MPNKPNTITTESQKKLLKTVIISAENLKKNVENKGSIVLATNSILLAALSSFLNPSLLSLIGKKSIDRILIYLIGAFIIFSVISILCSLKVLSAPNKRERRNIMGLSVKEFNIFYAGKIADFYDAKAYREAIKSLTTDELLEQYTNEGFNVSRLVMFRYKWFGRALTFLLLSVVLLPIIIIVTIAVN